jgi:ABC-type multidrug transport system ATPase subunit
MTFSTPAIDVENLTYSYGKRAEAIHGLSLKVQPGQCYALFGRNGAGKTTTIKCLLNLLRLKWDTFVSLVSIRRRTKLR